ncbi:MAG: isomerizing glutamine--fructose-6-phosphate transaminase, partial [Oligoflexia bacterium]|nr:isomerizing glutamine--fructose-6-phosphate transaminase [Oligoflexia bacterium]
ASLVHIVACGTAAHAGFYGQQIIESVAKVACRAELASEFRYRNPVLRSNDLGIVVSQSGETADTLAAVKLMKSAGMKVIAICNVRDSSIPRECDAVMYTNAGIEMGVASTKAFTTQMSLFAVLAAALGVHRKTLSKEQEKEWVDDLLKVPEKIRLILDHSDKVKAIADRYAKKKGFLFLGRGIYYPIALEGALKLKEIAYVHAEGYPSGELKHGPIAMVEPDMVVLAIAPEGDGLLHEKSVSNIEEVKARKGTLFSLVSSSDQHLQEISDTHLVLPSVVTEEVGPLLSVIPLQLFSYYVADALGTEIDQPRNLAKSVTVE